MAEKFSSGIEKGSRLARDINLALGASAIALSGIVPSPEIQAGLVIFGALQIAQAGLAEVVRRIAKGKKAKAVSAPA